MDYWLEVTGAMVQNGVIKKTKQKDGQMQAFYANHEKGPNFVQVIPNYCGFAHAYGSFLVNTTDGLKIESISRSF